MSDPSALQRIASDPSASVWVAASAGSGKTKVLTDRVLRLLLTGASPSRILCITYTKAASAEMQGRIHRRLAQWVVMDDAALKQELTELNGYKPPEEMARQARRLFALLLEDAPGLRIQTFHSFCQSLLARFPLEAGVAPHFTLIEEQDARDLLEEARLRLLQTAMGGEDARLSEAVTEIIEELGEKGYGELVAEIISRRREVEGILSAQGWAVAHNTRVYEALGLPAYGTSEVDILAAHVPLDDPTRQRIALLADILAQGGTQDNKLREKLRVFLESGNPDDLMEALLTQKGKATNKLMTVGLQKAHPDHFVFLTRLAMVCEIAKERLNTLSAARFTDAVAIAAESLFALYGAMKRTRGYLDYDDLILKTRTLLKGEGMARWVLYKIDGGIDHVLIDEAQDTSPEQWELKEVLEDEFFAGEGRAIGRTLFVVGDAKQSIYRFQGADPGGFASQLERTREKAASSRERFEEVPMHTSFRSAPAVLKAVDAVFTEGEGHRAFRAGAAGKVEIWPLAMWEEREEVPSWPVPESRKDSASPEMQLARSMATTIAARIREGVWRAGDVLVLVRRRGEFIHFLARCLKDRGVPVAGLDRMKVTDHLAVKDMMALAQFLLLPDDDYNLACLLKSPLYNCSEETLFALCHGREKKTLWERLRASAEDSCRQAAGELEALLSQADFGSPHSLFSEILYARDGRRRFMARMGEEVEEVLDVFLGLALEYERLHPPALQSFLSWLAHGTGEIKRDMEQGVDAVRIMTVHGAKGLEAPVVFLADTTSSIPLRDKIYFLPHGAHTLMLCTPRADTGGQAVTALREARRQEDVQESGRLLYVAMTRARDELYITGWGSKKNLQEESWYRLVERGVRTLEGVEERDDKTLLLQEQGTEDPVEEKALKLTAVLPLPDYARTLPPSEAPRTVLKAPSHLDDEGQQGGTAASPLTEGAAQARGILIHRLLQILSAISHGSRENTARRYLYQHAANMPQTEREKLVSEVLGVMHHPAFAAAFAPDALAEAPIVGSMDGQRLAGQVDRLIVREKEVLVVDFKTGAPPESSEVPMTYRRQMEAYRTLLKGMYPQREIRCALLYTSVPVLVQIA